MRSTFVTSAHMNGWHERIAAEVAELTARADAEYGPGNYTIEVGAHYRDVYSNTMRLELVVVPNPDAVSVYEYRIARYREGAPLQCQGNPCADLAAVEAEVNALKKFGSTLGFNVEYRIERRLVGDWEPVEEET